MAPEITFEPILTSLEKRELRGPSFRERVLVGLDLSGADLRDARFEHTLLESCNLAHADLRGVLHVLQPPPARAGARLGDNRFVGTTLTRIAGLTKDDCVAIQQAGGVFQPQYARLTAPTCPWRDSHFTSLGSSAHCDEPRRARRSSRTTDPVGGSLRATTSRTPSGPAPIGFARASNKT
jgi:hypothetical protein